MRFQKKAFTLVELSVVVAVISIIALIFSSIDFSSKNHSEKRDRIVGKISDTIRSVRTISTTGRSYSWSTGNICSDFVISFATGSIRTSFAQISDTGAIINTCGLDSEHSTSSPIFGEEEYAIKYMTGADISGNTTFCMGDCGLVTPIADEVKLIIKNGEVRIRPYLGGAGISTNESIKFNLRATFLEAPGAANEKITNGKNISFDVRSSRLCVAWACDTP